MELTNLSMFGLMRARMSWLGQRQEVIARNIANSDTPEYRARDLKALDPKDALRKTSDFALQVSMTDAQHLKAKGSGGQLAEGQVRRPFETAPAGNAVVLEEQMSKLNESQVNHSLITELYRKHLEMFKTSVRGGGR